MERLIKKRLDQHKEWKDPDGFFCCPVQYQLHTRVASEKEWLGTKQERQKALKDEKLMDRDIRCEFCDLCDELLKLLEFNKRVKK